MLFLGQKNDASAASPSAERHGLVGIAANTTTFGGVSVPVIPSAARSFVHVAR